MHFLQIEWSTLWAPVITASLITSILGSILAQAIDRYFKNIRETEKDLREIHSKCFNLKIKTKDLFRQLAMYKFHSQYWWHIHDIEPEGEYKGKYYLEHLRSQAEARETEKEIGEVKASFLAEIVKYEKLKGSSFNVDAEKLIIENLSLPKAKTYSSDISANVLREELAEADENKLREEYFKKLQVFQEIIDKMK